MRRVVQVITYPFRALASLVTAGRQSMPGFSPSASRRLASLRTYLARTWRVLVRWTLILLGFGIFGASQYGLSSLINQWMWWVIVALFVVVGTIAFAFAKPTQAFIGWIVFSPVVYYFFQGDFGKGLPPVSFDRLAIPVLVISLAGRALIHRQRLKRLNFAELLLVAFVIFSGFNLMFIQQATNTRLIGTYIDEVVLCAVIYFIAKAALKTRQHVIWAIKALVIVGFITGLALVIEAQTGYKWYGYLLGMKLRLNWTDVGLGRGTGLWKVPHTSQIFCSMTVLLALHFARWNKKTSAKLMYYAFAVVMVLAVYFAYSRTGYIAFGLMILLMPVTALGDKKPHVVLAAFVILSLVALTPWLLSNKQFEARMESDTATARRNINQTNINLIKHNLLFGVGHSRVRDAFEYYVANLAHRNEISGNMTTGLKILNKAHNFHLNLLGEEGLVGGLLYYGAIIAFLWQMFKLRRHLSPSGELASDIPTILFVATIANLIVLNFYSGPNVPYPAYAFWMAFALMTRLGEIISDKYPNKAADLISELPRDLDTVQSI